MMQQPLLLEEKEEEEEETFIQQQQEPILLPSLRAALSCLYGLSSSKQTTISPQYLHCHPNNSTTATTSDDDTRHQQNQHEEANRFLISFQSRNVRRAIEAMIQSQQQLQHNNRTKNRHNRMCTVDDNQNEDGCVDDDEEEEEDFHTKDDLDGSLLHENTTTTTAATTTSTMNNTLFPSNHNKKDLHYCGSTWLACVVLLCCTPDAHPTERLFAAQTLLHRMRKFDLLDAVDVEFEFITTTLSSSNYHHQTNTDNKNLSSTNNIKDINLNNMQLLMSLQNQPYYTPYITLYKWCSYCYPMLGQIMFPNGLSQIPEEIQNSDLRHSILQSYTTTTEANHQQNQQQQQQQQWKAEISLLALSASATLTSYHHILSQTNNNHNYSHNGTTHHHPSHHHHQQQQQQQQQQHSIIIALGGAISLTAIRLKYTTNLFRNDLPPIVTIITTSIHTSSATAFLLLGIPPPSGINRNDETNNDYVLLRRQVAIVSSVCATLAELPDALLGSVGGARGKLSLNPRCIGAAATEIRHPPSGIDLLLQIFADIPLLQSTSATSSPCAITTTTTTFKMYVHAILLDTIQKWACFIPLTTSFVEAIMAPLILPHLLWNDDTTRNNYFLDVILLQHCNKSAYALLIAIFEGSYLSEDQVLALSVGLSKSNSSSNNNVSAEARPKGKAKKRREQKLYSLRASEETANAAAYECFQRREVACHVVMHTLSRLKIEVSKSLEEAATEPDAMIDGEASIATVCAAASSVLPHLIRVRKNSSAYTNHITTVLNNSSMSMQNIDEMFMAIFETLKCICRNANRNVRRLAHESIKAIHLALIDKESQEYHPVTAVAIDGIFQCLMALASSCSYPDGYFNDLAQSADEDLENERNDVRDLLRSATNLEYGFSSSSASIEILGKLISSCMHAVQVTGDNVLPPEIAVHCLSALAKPLNLLVANLLKQDESTTTATAGAAIIVQNALQTLSLTCEKLLSHIPKSTIGALLPVSRLASLTIAAFSPTFSAICTQSSNMTTNPILCTLLEVTLKTLNLSIHQAEMSLLVIPELAAVSTLGETQYDIIGAMRAPGGEDHCSCIALMRLASESDSLCQSMWQVYTDPISDSGLCDGSVALLSDLCFLLHKLYQMERSRGFGVFHGIGVLPKSRRILLNVTFQIGLNAMKSNENNQSLVQKLLHQLVQAPLNNLSVASSPPYDTAARLHQLCEAAYDLGAFPFEIAQAVFSSSLAVVALENVVSVCIAGYNNIKKDSYHLDPASVQWGRLRGGLVSLFRACIGIGSGMPPVVITSLGQLIIAECKSVLGLNNLSNIEAFFGENMIPFGAFVKVLGEALERALEEIKLRRFSSSDILVSCTNVIVTLHEALPFVSQVATSELPEERRDPRPFIFEAWCVSLRNLACLRREFFRFEEVSAFKGVVEELLSQSTCLGLQLVLRTPLNRKKCVLIQNSGCMSLDGPHSLAMLEFMEEALEPRVLANVGETLASTMSLNFGLGTELPKELECIGGALILAVFFRMVSGALPPWVLESIPGLFCSLFAACNKDIPFFCQVLCLAVEARVLGVGYGGIDGTEKIGGPFIESISDLSKAQLICQAKASALRNDVEGWRRMKVTVKQICGGKKKGTSFNLKPPFSSWECDRL